MKNNKNKVEMKKDKLIMFQMYQKILDTLNKLVFILAKKNYIYYKFLQLNYQKNQKDL